MGKFTEDFYAQPSYRLENDSVDLHVSVKGGMCTATYKYDGKQIFPYFVAPWWNEAPYLDQHPIMQVMRGDYFCFPFGANVKPYNNVEYKIHGRTANECWDFKEINRDGEKSSLHLTMDLTPEDGEVEKILTVEDGSPVIYTDHVIKNFSGPASFGNHPNIQCSEETGTAILDMSPPLTGYNAPFPIDVPANMGYSILKPGEEIKDRTKVPTVYGDTIDLTRYPIPRGYEDVAMFISDPKLDYTFTAVTDPAKGFLYFQLKDPKVLASTLLWMPNNGRYSEPMNGRVIGSIGVEEVTGFFFYGRKESVEENFISKAGYTTFLDFDPEKEKHVRLISGAIPVRNSFQGVEGIVRKNKKEITILGRGGEKIDIPCTVDFLFE